MEGVSGGRSERRRLWVKLPKRVARMQPACVLTTVRRDVTRACPPSVDGCVIYDLSEFTRRASAPLAGALATYAALGSAHGEGRAPSGADLYGIPFPPPSLGTNDERADCAAQWRLDFGFYTNRC